MYPPRHGAMVTEVNRPSRKAGESDTLDAEHARPARRTPTPPEVARTSSARVQRELTPVLSGSPPVGVNSGGAAVQARRFPGAAEDSSGCGSREVASITYRHIPATPTEAIDGILGRAFWDRRASADPRPGPSFRSRRPTQEAWPRALELVNLAFGPTWARRMRLAGRSVVLAAVACFGPIAVGLPALLLVTVPLAALVARERPRGDKRGPVMNDTNSARQRRVRLIVVGIAIVVWALGLIVNSLPSEDMHDRYWYLFVAPSMIGFMVGVVALPMLVWSLLPRREA